MAGDYYSCPRCGHPVQTRTNTFRCPSCRWTTTMTDRECPRGHRMRVVCEPEKKPKKKWGFWDQARWHAVGSSDENPGYHGDANEKVVPPWKRK